MSGSSRRLREGVGSVTETEPGAPAASGRLVLRGEPEQPPASARRVRWTEDVIDNEHMNKKKTKICCIFRKQREFGESSSDESSSDSDSSSGSDSDSESESHNCSHDHGRPNAYERQPKYGKNATEKA